MLKSIIYLVNNVPNIEELASILGSIGTLPTSYLGLPLGADYKNCEVWNRIIDNLPTYYTYLLPIPRKVLKQLHKIRRDFLWEENSSTHKFYLIEWDKVKLPIHKGGLGVRDLASHNKSLIMKWLWRYDIGEPNLWKEVVKAKHGENDHWRTKISNAFYGVGP